jgi:hypothetical protein
VPALRALRPERTWPWAIAAAALLAISVGLHVFADGSAPRPPVDETRVNALSEAMGGTADDRAVAEWIVRQQQRAEAPAGVSWRALLAPAVPQ